MDFPVFGTHTLGLVFSAFMQHFKGFCSKVLALINNDDMVT